MKPKSNLLWLVAGMAIATVTPAQAADAASKDKKARIERLVKNQRNFEQPRTMAQADASQVKRADGTVQSAVPTELWSTLSVSKDADGKLQVVESEGGAAPAASEELDR